MLCMSARSSVNLPVFDREFGLAKLPKGQGGVRVSSNEQQRSRGVFDREFGLAKLPKGAGWCACVCACVCVRSRVYMS